MNPFRKLAGQTALYGLSTMVGRLLNYLLVPLYTYQFSNPEEFGVLTEFYAYASFLNVVLCYGMETALFNFMSKHAEPHRVYATALFSLLLTSVLFLAGMLSQAETLSQWVGGPGRSRFIEWMVWVLALDAMAAIPFARLRQQQRAGRFALLKTANILVNILGNLFFIGLTKWAYEHPTADWAAKLAGSYDPAVGIGYVFLANVIASAATLLFLLPELLAVRAWPDPRLWRRMLVYALPLAIAGLAGMVNETMDRVLLKYLLPPDVAMAQLGIYGACYKIAILMTIFIQAFRYAAEPFFFARFRDRDARETYAIVMRGFVIVCAVIYLAVVMNLDWIQYFVGAAYRSGLAVVPILLLANLCLGVFFNLSIWYKLTEQTRFGTYLTIWGAAVTLVLNFYGIPRYGYMASAWATLVCYGSMAVLSYVLGQYFYKVPYDLKRLLGYPLLASLLILAATELPEADRLVALAERNGILLAFLLLIMLAERRRMRSVRRSKA